MSLMFMMGLYRILEVSEQRFLNYMSATLPIIFEFKMSKSLGLRKPSFKHFNLYILTETPINEQTEV